MGITLSAIPQIYRTIKTTVFFSEGCNNPNAIKTCEAKESSVAVSDEDYRLLTEELAHSS
jgi:hypothetical protein